MPIKREPYLGLNKIFFVFDSKRKKNIDYLKISHIFVFLNTHTVVENQAFADPDRKVKKNCGSGSERLSVIWRKFIPFNFLCLGWTRRRSCLPRSETWSARWETRTLTLTASSTRTASRGPGHSSWCSSRLADFAETSCQCCGSMKFLVQIRIRRSIRLTTGFGSGSCYFRQRKKNFFAYYFFKVHFHHFSKKKSHKKILLFLLDDRRIRIRIRISD